MKSMKKWATHWQEFVCVFELIFVDPCIILQFLQWKTQQDATVYQIFIISYFKWSSRRFGHTAHHQEPKTAQAASGFACVKDCRRCSCCNVVRQRQLPDNVQQLHVRQPSTVLCKTRGCLCSFRLLMMGGVSPETCWASFKIRINKILIHCCNLLGFSL
jgi:hypothetical protein